MTAPAAGGVPNFKNRTLYHGDNLDFLRGMNSETIHLIATDPPFNKNRDFHATPDSLARGARFKDRWRWDDDVHEEWTDSIIDDWPAVWEVITAARAAYGDDMGAFLCWLGVRLMEMRRVLRVDGSIYLHCDQTASHYLKMMMDAIFGWDNFRNEIVWKRYVSTGKGSQHSAQSWGVMTDSILYYSKSKYATLCPYRELTDSEALEKFPKVDEQGRRYNTGTPLFRSKSMGPRPNLCYEWRGYKNPYPTGWRLKKERLEEEYQKGNVIIYPDGKLERRKYQKDYRGKPLGTLWAEHELSLSSNSKERTGYPTQKPLALYRRIIESSSNEGDIVLDPFCGCATTPVAAEQLKRQWVGIDIWDEAHDTVLERLQGEWLFTPGTSKKVMFPHEVHYKTEPPTRTDDKLMAAANLRLMIQRPEAPWQNITHRGMTNILAAAQASSGGVICAGCGRVLEREFMQLDHKLPKSDGGENHILNRVLLCGPCNRRKRNYLTLSGLVRENSKKAVSWMKDKGMAKMAQDAAREKAEWVRDHFHTRVCQDLIQGRESTLTI